LVVEIVRPQIKRARSLQDFESAPCLDVAAGLDRDNGMILEDTSTQSPDHLLVIACWKELSKVQREFLEGRFDRNELPWPSSSREVSSTRSVGNPSATSLVRTPSATSWLLNSAARTALMARSRSILQTRHKALRCVQWAATASKRFRRRQSSRAPMR
jgi:hypothetical protein